MLNRTVAPKIKEPVDFTITLPPHKKYTLSNGVEVYAVDMGSEETLMVNWVFYAGNWYEDKKPLAAATNFLLKNGTSKRSAFDINEHFEYHGAYLNRACYNETSELTLHCLNRHMYELLPVVAELVTDAVFPAEEIAIYQQNAKQRLQVSLQKCEFVAGRLIDAYLFGEQHPYGKYNNFEDYDAVQREDLMAFYDKYYRHGRCVIFVAGKLPADLLSELEKHFGSLPLRSHHSEITVVRHPLQPAAQKKAHIINDKDGVQAAIRIARPFPNRHHPDFMKVQVLNNIFGGFFGSRLMSNIREDKGYTYGIHSYLQNHIHDTSWVISTEAGRDVCAATVEEVYKEMKILREELVDEEELHLVRNFMMGSILGDLDGPFQIIARWKNYILNNLSGEYFYNALDTIRTVSAEELKQLANKYLNPEDFYELTVI